jgi:hypothetical protein
VVAVAADNRVESNQASEDVCVHFGQISLDANRAIAIV